MAKQNRSTIKTYFETGDVPTQTQFGDSFDSQVFWNDDVVTTLGTTDDKVPTEKAVSDAINAIATPTLQEVTDAGASTTDAITTAGLDLISGVEKTTYSTNGQIDVIPDTGSPTNKISITFSTPTGNNSYNIPDKGGSSDTFAMLSDITGGGVSSVTGTCVDNTDPVNPVVNALALDGSNANSDVDLGAYALNAKSVKVNGTGGAGHVSMKHQSSAATAAASESVIYADNTGNPQWKNDGSAVERLLLQSDITQTITNGVTTKAPSEDAVFDALALKANLSQAAYSMLANNTGSTANMSAVTFKSVSKQTYSPSVNPSWTGTTPPSGATQHSYSWIQVGNCVSFYVCLVYATAGTLLSQVVFSLPSDMPTPLKPDGITAVTDVIAMCSGQLAASNGLSSNIARAALRIDSVSTSAFQFVVASSSANYRQAWISGVYFTS